MGKGGFGSTVAAHRNCLRNMHRGRVFAGTKPSRGCTTGADKEALIAYTDLEVTELRLSQAPQQDKDDLSCREDKAQFSSNIKVQI